MAVESQKPHVFHPERQRGDARRFAGADRRAEFGIHAAGAYLFVSVRVDPGREPKQNILRFAHIPRYAVERTQLFLTVDGEQPYAALHAIFDVGIGLVVAVEARASERKRRRRGGEKLARRNDIGTHTLGAHHAVYFFEAKRLGREQRVRTGGQVFFHGGHVFAAARAHAVFVYKYGGRAEFFGERNRVAPGEKQMPVFAGF